MTALQRKSVDLARRVVRENNFDLTPAENCLLKRAAGGRDVPEIMAHIVLRDYALGQGFFGPDPQDALSAPLEPLVA
jgi:hypothetical protein